VEEAGSSVCCEQPAKHEVTKSGSASASASPSSSSPTAVSLGRVSLTVKALDAGLLVRWQWCDGGESGGRGLTGDDGGGIAVISVFNFVALSAAPVSDKDTNQSFVVVDANRSVPIMEPAARVEEMK